MFCFENVTMNGFDFTGFLRFYLKMNNSVKWTQIYEMFRCFESTIFMEKIFW